MRSAVKHAKAAIAENADNKQELVRVAVKKVDKAAQANLIHDNKADRIKSQLMSADNNEKFKHLLELFYAQIDKIKSSRINCLSI